MLSLYLQLMILKALNGLFSVEAKIINDFLSLEIVYI